MTQHSSLKSGRRRKRHRSVLKRFERIAILKDKKEWDGEHSVFGIPKVKTIRIKMKKEKAAAEAGTTPETTATEGQVTPTSGKEKAATAPAKEKPAPPKKEKEK